MPKITHKTYFTKRNKYLSNSKVGDFNKSKAYFKRKHILGKVEKKESPALLLGSMVDTYLTEGPAKFRQLFVPVARRSLKNPPTGYTEVTQAVYDQGLAIATKVASTKAFKDLKKYKKQVILQHDIKDFSQFPGIAGMLDFLLVDMKNKKAHIRDLKTSKTADMRKYFWHAIGFGYHRQMAMYGWLVSETFGIPRENITYGHLVVEKDPDAIYKVVTFMFDTAFITTCMDKLKEKVYQIDAETRWLDDEVTWENAYIINEKGSYEQPTN